VAPDGTLILAIDYCSGLTDAELAGLLCHEVMHPALRCWERQGDRQARVVGPVHSFSLWNLAHDLSFNPMIRDMGAGSIRLPEGGVFDPSLAGMSAEEIYDVLLTRAPLSNADKGWRILTILPSGVHTIGDDMRSDLSSTKLGREAAKGSRQANERLAREWGIAVVAAAQVQEREKGQIPAALRRIVDDLVESKVDWKEALSRWVGENGKRCDYSYRRPSRRSESVGSFLPSLVRQGGVADLTVLWDTSGSMHGSETEILSEVHAICLDLGITVRVLICDCAVHADITGVENALDIIPHLVGGGGSDFVPAFNLLEKEAYAGVVVAFTDGYIDVPSTQPPHLAGVLWVVGPNDIDPTEARWGELIRIDGP
jgi:predicted metal-dependent peptidase